MNPLQSRLAALRRRFRFVVTMRGVCLTTAALLAGITVAGLIDALVYQVMKVETWALLRAGFLAATLSLSGLICYRLLLRPLTARTDDLSLALRVEEQYPILNDALASTVQFLEPGMASTSPSLQKEAVQRALRLAQGCDFNKAVSQRGLTLSAAALVVLLAIIVPLILLQPTVALTALVRVADPFGDHPWTGRQTELVVHYPAFLALGQPLSITGQVRGVVPAKADIEFDEVSMPPRQVDIKTIRVGEGNFVASGIKLPNSPREIRFRVRAGDAVSPREAGNWHKIALRQPPYLVALNGKPSPQVVIRQPRYTELAEFVMLQPGTPNLNVVAGSHVTLRAATDRPIERAWIEFKPLASGVKESLMLAGLGPRHLLDGIMTNALANSVWGRVPGVVEPSGREFTVRFLPAVSGDFILTIQDKEGLANSFPYELHVQPDPAPKVGLLRPSASQSVLANAEITLQIQAEDEVFALRTVFLEYRRKDKHGKWLDSEPKRLSFYDHAKAESGLPQVLRVFSSLLPFTPTALGGLQAEPLHLRPQKLLIRQRWSLRGLAVEGETLVIQACAEDFNDVTAFPPIGRSHEIELKIVAKTALSSVIDEHEAQIQQQLLKLRDMQDKAIKKVIGAEQQWRASGKLRPEDLLDLTEAEQTQRDIQARIGAKKDEGLRGELAQLEEMLKDNKLPKSDVTERIHAIKEEVDRLQRESLPQIEPSLNKARRELEAPEQPKQPSPKEAGDLGTARAQQEKVYQSLDDLLKFLDEQSNFQQVKGELRAILAEQQEREKEVAKLQELTDLKNDPAILKENPFKGELRRTEQLQRRLGDRAEKLIDKLNDLSEKMADVNPTVSEMLARAARIGGPLPGDNVSNPLSALIGWPASLLVAYWPGEAVANAMRDTANDLRDDFDAKIKGVSKWKGPYLHGARATQGKIIEALERMLEALDQSRADEIERLVVRQKNEEKRINELADKMAQLQENIEKASKIANPQAREATLKKLGDELRQLQKDAENVARDLGHAQAKDAANDLKDAAKRMERVLRELDRGENPEESLQPALDRIDSAKDKLKEARDMAQEELSREQIAKIVDRLKGLKERQDATFTESERLRKDFLVNSKWTYPKVQSLGEMRGAQEGVAGETAFLKGKLKEAKVFHTVLDRAHQDMLGATNKAKDWQTKAIQHQAPKTLNESDFAEEKTLYEATVKLQKNASDRLQRLIDALLPELETPKDDPKQAVPQQGGGGGAKEDGQKKGGIQAQDGIPGVAQLKALKAEQLDINARTKEFAEQHPNFDNLTASERTELEAIRSEQDRLLQLFRELATAGQAEGGKR